MIHTPSPFHSFSGKRALGLALCVIGLMSVLHGCNRVPGKRGSPSTAKASTAKTPATQSKLLAAIPSTESGSSAVEVESIGVLCERSCEHWVGLQFADPINYDKLSDSARVNIDELLSKQRRDNFASCQAACLKHDQPATPACILQAMTADECGQCISL